MNIKSYSFSKLGIETLGADDKELNWPVVYQIYDTANLYVGETTNLKNRMQQHIQNPEKMNLQKFSVVIDESYNKSVALDLESQLIQWFGGDGRYTMLNRNYGIADREYFNRPSYQKQFSHIWDQLREQGVASKSISEIENSGLFKFSPYKRLNDQQLQAVTNVLMDLEEAFMHNRQTISVIGGNEGTGKTIVVMYLIKLLRDIQDYAPIGDDEEMSDNNFDIFFKEPFNSRFKGKTIALVIPNPSLKGSVTKIFKTISNLSNSVDVLSPIDFGSNGKTYDVTFVDEGHLLKASNQEVHKANRERVNAINKTLFDDSETHTELDWIMKKSKNVVMVYGDQRIRPNNISSSHLPQYDVKEYILKSQMRSNGGELYIDYLREMLSDKPPVTKQQFDAFEFKLFNDFKTFTDAIYEKEKLYGLSRIVAGFAWRWLSNKDKSIFDIKIDGIGLQWNIKLSDWVGSANSINEVGSIYTIQGYDLNYCGVIIGNDLRYDPINQKLIFDKNHYHDRGAKRRSREQIDANTKLTDAELLDQVIRTYRILMNRSIKGTYVYVCDENLRNYLSKYIDIQ